MDFQAHFSNQLFPSLLALWLVVIFSICILETKAILEIYCLNLVFLQFYGLFGALIATSQYCRTLLLTLS